MTTTRAWSDPELGFRWWGSELAQRVWSEPGLNDHGVEVFRVFARTELLKGVSDVPRATQGIDGLNGMAVGSALIVDADERTVSSTASMWVHEETRDWVSRTFSLEVPYRQTTTLIQLDTTEPHPALGNGLLVRVSLPGDHGPGPEWASMRNQQELDLLNRSHFLGSWVGSASFPTFASFYPNFVARAGMGSVNIALSSINRAMWVASLGRTGE